MHDFGPLEAEIIVVLLHGHCLRTESWSYLRAALGPAAVRARIVGYDHRGHGESAESDPAHYTLDRLAHDLHTVLDAVAGSGPVVLVGHSMGGMTALTYARHYPEEIGTRIAGLALIATAANGLPEAGFGRFLRNPAVSWFQAAVRGTPAVMQQAKRFGCRVFAPVVRAAEFGNRTVSPRVIALANAMHNETPIVTMASFLSEFITYDESAVLPSLGAIATLVLCGSADLMTPPSHSVAMAAEIPGVELVSVEGAGHAVIMERPDAVAEALARLVDRIGDEKSPLDPEFAIAA
ncbi:MAG: alpha/beta hydrolase [Aldersonia sp.]|nr:alpha/beta hydrolase [Aldersonia sp.]